ncbi:ABC-2 type transporter-domain-containing protein [Russula earlei]|uniref:ABC-2 type transporter-domain-containing protein n=1 Tax=Russula earlei TaxID=71964 RepID=A0ACC0U9F8_9AGAM|nr:ABC-2 type transporter-domain-containing protein [Russula earlei]
MPSPRRNQFSWKIKTESAFRVLLRPLTTHPSQGHNQCLEPVPPTKRDVEKGPLNTYEPSNFQDCLTSSSEAYKAAGIPFKQVGVTWEDLQVRAHGDNGDKTYISTFDCKYFGITGFTLVRSVWRIFTGGPPARDGNAKTVLNRCSGLTKPGEMILVLGCPGSGCTTFLKAIANERGEYFSIGGDLGYAGIDALEMGKTYKGETVYNQNDDVHIATLTVAQTLAFALSTKTPGSKGRLPGISSREFDSRAKEMLLRMLNISHISDTLVGDEFVRGISGGERKRVSIVEMMSTRAPVQCWDNPTRGLDASTALDFAKGLRIMTDVLGQTHFVTLYQASEGIYELFDRVLVLDKGRQIYLGPPSLARAYFEALGFKSLPRQPTADFLTGCTDPNERQLCPGRSAADVPSTPEALEQAFQKSLLAIDLHNELEEYKASTKGDQEAFESAVLLDKNSGVSKKSPYTVGYTAQVMALTRRQFQMRLQDRFQLATSFSLSVVLAGIIGAAFFDQPSTSNGAFTRASVIFFSMFTSCLDAFGELSMQTGGRGVLNKQGRYSLYRPSALALGNALSDLPFSSIRVLVYDVIIYFMVDLHRSWDAFGTFHLFNYMAFLSIQGLFRTLGFFFSSYDTAYRFGAFLVTGLVSSTGYLIPVHDMKKWLSWIFYVNPMAYAFSGLMQNEYNRHNFTCDGSYVIPRNGFNANKYPSSLGPNQVCTLFGASPGYNITTGRSYLLTAYGMVGNDIWCRNFLVLLGWISFYQITQILILDLFRQDSGETVFALFARETSETRKLNARLRERKLRRSQARSAERNGSNNTERSVTIPSDRGVFTWEDLNYQIPVSCGTRQLLSGLYGYVKPGTLTALMGASGAGKTTCLDVLAERKNIGVVCGDILVDGHPTGSDFARSTAYAEQMDVHEGTATVREAMQFSASLRQPFDITSEEKNAYVEGIIELLELHDFADAIVHSLGNEVRKRLTIGVELASKPGLLLFLDEPTSGLDAHSARNLVRILRRLADQGQAILCTIHQPSSLLFESFDRLLLLENGGHTVYFGDIGPDSCVVREYFARYGAACHKDANFAEYMLDVIGAGMAPRIGRRDWKDIWLDSPESHLVKEEIRGLKRSAMTCNNKNESASKYATPFLYQLRVVTKRSFVTLWRSPGYVFTRLFLHLSTSLFISLVFLQLGRSQRDLQYRVFSIFWVTVLPSILLNQILPVFMTNRGGSALGYSAGMYSPEVFAIAQLLGELPHSVLSAFVYWVIMIYAQGWGQGSAGSSGNGLQLVAIIFVELFGVSLGQLVAAITPSVQVGILLDPFIMVVLTVFCGVIIPYPNLVHTWRVWVYQFNPFTRLMSAMLSTEVHGLQIRCKPVEFAIFDPPPGQSCATWANDFVDAFGGYLENPNDTQRCRYCQYKACAATNLCFFRLIGDEYIKSLNMPYDDRWKDTCLIFAFFGEH